MYCEFHALFSFESAIYHFSIELCVDVPDNVRLVVVEWIVVVCFDVVMQNFVVFERLVFKPPVANASAL